MGVIDMQKKVLYAVFLIGLAVAMLVLPFVLAQPTGGSVSEINTERAPADGAGSDGAYAGNITQIDVTAFSTTQSWQGYAGNVSGTLQLADSNDNVLYNWTLASPEGEVYASVNQTIAWTNVQCFNFTASGSYADDTSNAGATSQFGTNLTALEARYGIASDDVDGINETFSFSGVDTHDLFYTASREFTAGECLSTNLYSDAGEGVANEFEEVILYEPTTTSVVWVALLEETSVLGYNDADNDFQMIVPEDGHGTDVATTTYFFWVELE